MAVRSIVVRLRAQVDGFKREMAEATKAVDQTAAGTEAAAKRADTAMGRMVQSAQENEQAWNTAGTALTGFGAATLGGLGLATKAAMDWESAWAGVQKTVDGTAPQMDALEAGLRGMARELPATHAEIAAVAEAAGQLGIATPNVLGFTRTMIDLGEATNMGAEEAATALARFMNITQTSQSEVGKLGATVVGLGNNFAVTESEIVALSMRLAGAATQAGLTEGEIMGMAAAMGSVGIEAEAGGSAMSMTMKRIGKAVEEGGASLDLFAQVSGMTSEQFATAWETRPAEALNAFIGGLSRTEQMGMSTNAVLTELGITGIRESDALLRLSAATGLAADAMAMGNDEWEKGTALIEEASKRYETAESRIAMARNAIVDAAISIGGVALPAFAELADGVANVAGWFADLPQPVQGTIAALGGIAGVASLGAGGFLLLFPRVMDTVSAFRELRDISPRTASAVGRVGKAVGIASAAFAAISTLAAYGDSLNDVTLGANEAAVAVTDLAKGSDPITTLFDGMHTGSQAASASTEQLARDLDVLANGHWYEGISNLETNIRNVFGAGLDTTDDIRQRLEEVGQGLAVLTQADLPAAQEAFTNLWQRFGGTDEAGQNLLKTMPALRDELIGIASGAGLATDDATLLKIATGELTPVVDEASGAVTGFEEGLSGVEQAAVDATSALDDHLGAITDVANAFLESRDATRDFEDALADAYDLLDENAGADHWGDDTQAARDYEEAVDGVAAAYLREVEAARANGDSTAQIMQDRRDDIIALGEAYNIPQDELNEYLELLGLTPETIEQTVELETNQAKAEWAALWDELGYHTPQVPVGADTEPAEGEVLLFEDSIVSSDPTLAPVGADTGQAEADVLLFSGAVTSKSPADMPVGANVEPAQWEVNALNEAINNSGGTVTINGNTVPGDQALDILLGIINSSDGTVTINGMPVPAEEALGQAIRLINSSGGTVEIDGDNSGAVGATDSAKSHADNTTGTIDVDANTSAANAAIDAAARSRTAYVNVVATGATSYLRAGMRHAAFATGGPIYGQGTGTSDSVPILASNGEHMLTAAEVALAGGHDSVYRMRAAIRAGALRFAEGGAIGDEASLRMSLPATPSWGRNVTEQDGSSRPSLSQTNNIYGPDANQVTDRAMAKMRHFVHAQAVPLP